MNSYNKGFGKGTLVIASLVICLSMNSYAENLGTSNGNSAGSFTAGTNVDGQLNNTDTSVDSQMNIKKRNSSDSTVNGMVNGKDLNAGAGLDTQMDNKNINQDRTTGSVSGQTSGSTAGQTTGSTSGMTTGGVTSPSSDTTVEMENNTQDNTQYPNSTDSSPTNPAAPIGQ